MSFKSRFRSMLFSLSFILVATWLVFAGILYVTQEQLIFIPSRHLTSDPSAVGLGYENVTLDTPDGERLHGWYVPAENPKGVLLFLHGNAGNISHRLASIEIFHQLDLSTFIIDYRGYGSSTGKISETGSYVDAETAWNHLTMARGHAPREIIIFGRSLGAAIAAWLAARVDPAGVILESPFRSLESLARQYYPYMPVGTLLRNHYPTETYVAAIHRPILIIHSREDELIPYSHGESLAATAAERAVLHTIHGGHNEGFLLSGETYVDAIRKFSEDVLN